MKVKYKTNLGHPRNAKLVILNPYELLQLYD